MTIQRWRESTGQTHCVQCDQPISQSHHFYCTECWADISAKHNLKSPRGGSTKPFVRKPKLPLIQFMEFAKNSPPRTEFKVIRYKDHALVVGLLDGISKFKRYVDESWPVVLQSLQKMGLTAYKQKKKRVATRRRYDPSAEL